MISLFYNLTTEKGESNKRRWHSIAVILDPCFGSLFLIFVFDHFVYDLWFSISVDRNIRSFKNVWPLSDGRLVI